MDGLSVKTKYPSDNLRAIQELRKRQITEYRIKTMLNIGDCVLHKQTGRSGKVFGYGYQMVNSAYLPTLIVRVAEAASLSQKSFVEDLSSSWMLVEEASQLSAHPAR